MTCLLKILRSAACVAGVFCLLFAAGTSDFSRLEMGTATPGIAWNLLLVGVVLIAPSLIRAWVMQYGR